MRTKILFIAAWTTALISLTSCVGATIGQTGCKGILVHNSGYYMACQTGPNWRVMAFDFGGRMVQDYTTTQEKVTQQAQHLLNTCGQCRWIDETDELPQGVKNAMLTTKW